MLYGSSANARWIVMIAPSMSSGFMRLTSKSSIVARLLADRATNSKPLQSRPNRRSSCSENCVAACCYLTFPPFAPPCVILSSCLQSPQHDARNAVPKSSAPKSSAHVIRPARPLSALSPASRPSSQNGNAHARSPALEFDRPFDPLCFMPPTWILCKIRALPRPCFRACSIPARRLLFVGGVSGCSELAAFLKGVGGDLGKMRIIVLGFVGLWYLMCVCVSMSLTAQQYSNAANTLLRMW